MKLLERAGLYVLHRLDPEKAHGLSIRALRSGFAPLAGPVNLDILHTEIAGLNLKNPIGLAAGYDKNAQAVKQLGQTGFGFIEVGAVTPRPQPGNPRPRLFRLTKDQAVINRFGFNNDGMKDVAERLAKVVSAVPVGLNLGANKDSIDKADDFAKVLMCCGGNIDFATVNVSSPNTEKLRDLQGAEALHGVLSRVLTARSNLARAVPVFVKIAPDLSDQEICEVAQVCRESKIDGIIATNTTITRPGLTSKTAQETGGLSGAPLFDLSTRVLAKLSFQTNGEIPIFGVGGISSSDDAYQKIRAGASAVQLYSAMVYNGLSVVRDIANGLASRLANDGFGSVADAVATGREEWL